MLLTYQNLSTRFYNLFVPSAPVEELAFYRSYVEQVHGKILEPMCGSGNFLIPYSREGYDIEGFDASVHMLEILNRRAASAKVTVRSWLGFLEQLEQNYTYDLIFIPSGSFGLITDTGAVRECLRRMYQHLSLGGIFVFEAETSHALPEQLECWYQDVVYESSDVCIVRNTYPELPVDGVIQVKSRYELVENGQVVGVEFEDFKLRIYESAALEAILKDIGFEVRLVKAYNRQSKPEDADSTVVYECVKT